VFVNLYELEFGCFWETDNYYFRSGGGGRGGYDREDGRGERRGYDREEGLFFCFFGFFLSFFCIVNLLICFGSFVLFVCLFGFVEMIAEDCLFVYFVQMFSKMFF
jgi:hypothetical protein